MLFGTQHPKSRLGASFVLPTLALSLSFAACGGDSKPEGTADAYITNDNNYTSSGTLTIPHVKTAPGADLNICWPALTKNLLCHDVAPAQDIANVTFLQIPGMSEQDIATQFASGTFDSDVVEVYRSYRTDQSAGSTCAKLSAFKFGQQTVNPSTDYVVDASIKYMLLFSDGLTPGVGSQTMLFLDPDPASSNSEVAAPVGCGILDFKADLTTPRAVDIPSAGPTWVVDWGKLTKDGLGNVVIYQNIDGLMVGYYENMTVADLQAQALDYDRIATKLYTADVPMGTKQMDLASTKTSGGEAFAGFSPTNGVWAVGLLCSECQIPAPVAVVIVNPT